jgi:hypothetical protein
VIMHSPALRVGEGKSTAAGSGISTNVLAQEMPWTLPTPPCDLNVTNIGFCFSCRYSEKCRLLGCDAVWLLLGKTFRRYGSPPASEWKE